MAAEAERIGWLNDRLDGPWGGLKRQGCAGCYIPKRGLDASFSTRVNCFSQSACA
ncbi:uncharacterized protein TrAtP1_008669 [Trichoderma atroviride]|uniref:uncharacterized protein n=1 Tax=Hypocrea atroviridis TaxID=63577 RepID=UPI00332A91F6|nr:hypothetical protein TrAtP1_008669 [Trichoderma atroviride]